MRVAYGLFILALIGGAIGTAKGAESAPQNAFTDAKTVDEAAQDVTRMPKGEIGEFIEYLAHCADATTEFARYECGVSQNRFRIRFQADRAIDRWVDARKPAEDTAAKTAKSMAPIENAARLRAQQLMR